MVILGFGPRGELPSPSLARPLPSPFFSPARPLPPRRTPPGGSTPAPGPAPGLAPPAPGSGGGSALRPWPLRARARARRRLGPVPVRLMPGGSAPCPSRPLPRRPQPRPHGPSAWRPAAWRPAAPRRVSRALRLASRQPCALSVLSCAPTCAQRVRARATVVVRHSTLSFISYSIFV
jgi:hypothetical protein